MKILKLNRILIDEQAEALKGQYLDESYIKFPIITEDCDAYDNQGKLLLKFRKNVLPLEILKLGVDSFKGSVMLTESRGMASGGSFKRIRKDGTKSKITVSNKVESGAVGFMDEVAMVPYCRKTAFTSEYFNKFQAGVPFVKAIDKLYSELAPEHYKIQRMYADGTNRNYVIKDTAFTTVTVNKDFRTALHKDAGDLPQGFGNLIAYREGNWKGAYFMMPEFGIAVDLQNCDVLFCDVHHFHCNTPFIDFTKDCVRYSFVLYYREFMLKCKGPSKELERIKLDKNGFFRL